MKPDAKCRSLAAACLLVVTAVTAARADTVLTYSETLAVESRQKSGESTHQVEISLGAERARYEDPRQTLLLDTAAAQLIVVDPTEKHYSVVDHPLRLEDQAASESEKRALTLWEDPRIEIEDTGQVEKVGPWKARKYRVTIYDRHVDQEIFAWLSTEPAVDAADVERLHGLLLDNGAMRPPAHSWLQRLFEEHGGIPVLLEEVVRLEAGASISARTRTRTRRLLSVEERDVAPEVYQAPAYFEERPFDLSRYLGVKGF